MFTGNPKYYAKSFPATLILKIRSTFAFALALTVPIPTSATSPDSPT
jgi:hypothetical protein